jgi:hypothetical protein
VATHPHIFRATTTRNNFRMVLLLAILNHLSISKQSSAFANSHLYSCLLSLANE